MSNLVIAIFSSLLLSFTEGLFPFPYVDFSSLFDESRAKNIHFSTCTLPNCYARCVYACCSITAPVYQDLCQKIQNEVEFPCHNRRSLILGLPYTGNISDSALQLHSVGYKRTILNYGKEGEGIQL
jgi:hypothetical protein